MRASVSHQLIAAAGVRDLGLEADDVESVEVDEVQVDLAKAQKTLAKRETADGNWLADKIDEGLCKIADKLTPKEGKKPGALKQKLSALKSNITTTKPAMKIAAMKKRFDKTAAGKKLNELVLNGDPETVKYTGTARVKLKSGETKTVDVSVVDVKKSLQHQRISIASGLLGIALGFVPVPLIDNAVPALIGAGTLLGAGVAKAANNPQLATAMKKTAGKHFLLTVFGMTPIKIKVMLDDVKDVKGLRSGEEQQ